MAAIYDNSAFIHSYQQRFHLTDKDSDESEVRSAKWTKVLLIVVGVSLVFALGVICALSLLYVGKISMCDSQQHNDTKPSTDPEQNVGQISLCDSQQDNDAKPPTDPLQSTEMDLKYHRVKDCLDSCTAYGASSCKLCEEGWTAYGGKCYFFSSVNKTWFEAHDVCAGLKAHLVTINSKAVQDFLVSKIKETHWIGLNDQETEGRWVWLNDQSLAETGVKFWFDNQPDNWEVENPSGENCACMGYKLEFLNFWFDASCEYKKKFICEKKFIALE